MVYVALISMVLAVLASKYIRESYNLFQKADKYLVESLGKLEENEFNKDRDVVKNEFLVATKRSSTLAQLCYPSLFYIQGINTLVLLLALTPNVTLLMHSLVNTALAIGIAGVIVLLKILHERRKVVRSACSYIWNLLKAIEQDKDEHRKYSDDPSLS